MSMVLDSISSTSISTRFIFLSHDWTLKSLSEKKGTVRTEIWKSEKLRLNQTIWKAFAGQKVPKQQSKMGLGLRGVGIDDGMW